MKATKFVKILLEERDEARDALKALLATMEAAAKEAADFEDIEAEVAALRDALREREEEIVRLNGQLTKRGDEIAALERELRDEKARKC